MLNTFQWVLIHETMEGLGYCTKGYIMDIDDDEIIQYESEDGINYCIQNEIIVNPAFTGNTLEGLLEVRI